MQNWLNLRIFYHSTLLKSFLVNLETLQNLITPAIWGIVEAYKQIYCFLPPRPISELNLHPVKFHLHIILVNDG